MVADSRFAIVVGALAVVLAACGRLGFDGDIATVDADAANTGSDAGCAFRPVHRWRFDGTLDDDAGGVTLAPIGGAPIYVPGVSGQALAADASRVAIATLADAVTNDYTASLFCMETGSDANTEHATVFGVGNFGGSSGELFSVLVDHLGGDAVGFSQWGDLIRAPTPFGSAMHHVAVVRRGPEVALYVDGVNVGTGASFLFAPPAMPSITVGGSTYTNTETRRFIGVVDDLALFDYALTPAEVALEAVSNTSVPCP